MLVTIKYGSGNQITKNVSAGTSLGSILGDANIRAALGFGANVEGQIGGVTQANTLSLQEGMVVVVTDKACSKAATFTIEVTMHGSDPVPVTADDLANLFTGISGGQVKAEFEVKETTTH